jgi:hypothetical protein
MLTEAASEPEPPTFPTFPVSAKAGSSVAHTGIGPPLTGIVVVVVVMAVLVTVGVGIVAAGAQAAMVNTNGASRRTYRG